MRFRQLIFARIRLHVVNLNDKWGPVSAGPEVNASSALQDDT
jgi:hypothetical protein